jgi:hypothetical protein
MEYVIGVYDSDGQIYKIYGKRKNLNVAKKFYEKTLENNVVYFERTTLNKNSKHKELKFYLYLLKEKEVGDEETIVRDSLGRLVREKFKDDRYSIVDRSDFKIEESFSVFGFNGRLTFKEILKKLLLNNRNIKYVFYFLNKLVIEDYDDMQIVICKNKKDARKLHDVLFEFFRFNKIKKGIFMNELKKENRRRVYEDIKKKTGWKTPRLYRNSTRP